MCVAALVAVFSNIVPGDFLAQLAEADVHSVVKQVQEFYGDYYAVNSDLFSLDLGKRWALLLPAVPCARRTLARLVPLCSVSLSSPRSTWNHLTEATFERAVQGVVSCLLSLKMKPFLRYQATSEVCQLFSRRVSEVLTSERELFQFGRAEGSTLLLVLDRREDPVTPLLSQWTYQAMVHELLRIDKNTVDLSRVPDIHPDLRWRPATCRAGRRDHTTLTPCPRPQGSRPVQCPGSVFRVPHALQLRRPRPVREGHAG